MTSYFDVLPKEIFVIIVKKMKVYVFDGICVAYPRYVNLFIDANFWYDLCKDDFDIDIPRSSDAYYWQETYRTLLGNAVSIFRSITNHVSPVDVESLYKIKRDYPIYYKICKNINLYVSGIIHEDVSWADVYSMLQKYGAPSYREFLEIRAKPRQYSGTVRSVHYYIRNYIRRFLDKNFVGNIPTLIHALAYNYSIYDNIMKMLSPSTKTLMDTFQGIDENDTEYITDPVIIKETIELLRDDFLYRIRTM